jgi:hypothetical protein
MPAGTIMPSNHRFERSGIWNCHMDVATDSKTPWARVRKANQSHAFDSPVPGEGKEARTARPDEEESMIGIKQLRFSTTQPCVAQPHR